MLTRFAAILIVAIAPSILLAGDLKFKKHVINQKADYSAAALIDVNRDGRIDVVCGGEWYESPHWTKHVAAKVPRIGGRPDGFSHLGFDVNRDGWTDVITVNYRSRSIKWMEHPGDGDSPWELHTVVEPGPMETGRLVDVDGDGQLDLLPNGRNFAAWWEFRWKDKTTKGAPAWIRHELPKDAKGHGVGFGDIDGDGRGDIVGQSGWLKASTDARSGEWHWRPEFKIERGSVPMLVVDPDNDGDNDIVWSSAHGFGIYWLENTTTADGERVWQRHAIDTSWSQCHAPLWADMDGDGQKELIAGKRYMAHGGSDPGAYDPLVVYRYQFNPATRTWDRWTVSNGEQVGLGLDPKVADIDNDGDLDLLACGRSGLYWLENKGVGTTEPAKRSNMSGSKKGIDSENIDTPENWGRRRSEIVRTIETAHGGILDCSQRVPLRTTIENESTEKDFVVRNIQYWIDKDRQVSAKLFVPNTANEAAKKTAKKATASGLVCLFDPLSTSDANQLVNRLASLGYVCIVPDIAATKTLNPTMDSVWQTMRAADVLQATLEVNAERIGFVGDALAGTLGLYIAALDQRFVATATDASRSTSLETTTDSYSTTELVAAVAPRSLRITLSGDATWKHEIAESAKVFAKRKVAKKLAVVSNEELDFDRTIDWVKKNLPTRR